MILNPDLSDIVAQTGSDAERRVARLLSKVNGPHDAVAFHSVKLRSHSYKQQAEADFVILWKGVVVVVEVKGGGVRKHEGIWYSIDRRNDWHKLASSPMEQASSAMFALREILREDGVGWFAHEAIVITPDIEAPPRSVEWKVTHWLAQEDMTSAGLTSALELVAAGRRSSPPRQRVARSDELRERLFCEFSRMPTIDAQRGAVIEEQDRATANQARVLASLARNQRMLVYGGAGTGKSLVLVEAAKQEAAAGRSVLVTFRSPLLSDFFSLHLAERDIDVVPFGELRTDKVYDVVLIDEAQDLMVTDAMDRLSAVISGGWEKGRWRMFLDPNNQAHVDGHFDQDVLDLVADDASSFDLDRNVRNTSAIVHVVQEYLGADIGDPGIVHGERIQWHWSQDAADVGAASRIARELMDGGVKKSAIWIIDVGSDGAPNQTSDGITVMSPRYAKGLEAECVVVCGLPSVLDDRGIAAIYVAVTRARVSLHIVASGSDKKRLQRLARLRGV